jgi:hypothetical protein
MVISSVEALWQHPAAALRLTKRAKPGRSVQHAGRLPSPRPGRSAARRIDGRQACGGSVAIAAAPM